MTFAGTRQALQRGRRLLVVTDRGRSMTVDLSSYYPEDSDERIHVGDDKAVTDAALRTRKDGQAASTLASSAPSISALSASSTSES